MSIEVVKLAACNPCLQTMPATHAKMQPWLETSAKKPLISLSMGNVGTMEITIHVPTTFSTDSHTHLQHRHSLEALSPSSAFPAGFDRRIPHCVARQWAVLRGRDNICLFTIYCTYTGVGGVAHPRLSRCSGRDWTQHRERHFPRVTPGGLWPDDF